MRRSAKLVILLCSIALLAGCAATTLPEFEAEQTSRDVIADATALSNVDAASTRFVGDVEGYELYVARGDGDTVCLIHMRDGEYESTGCGAALGVGIELQSGTLIEVGTFSFPENRVGDGERTELSESVTLIVKP